MRTSKEKVWEAIQKEVVGFGRRVFYSPCREGSMQQPQKRNKFLKCLTDFRNNSVSENRVSKYLACERDNTAKSQKAL